MRSLIDKARNMILSLRFSILSIVISLFILVMFVVMSISYLSFSRAINKVAFQLMQDTANTVYTEMTDEIQAIAFETIFFANLIHSGLINPDNKHDMMNYTYNVMKSRTNQMPSAQAAFWSDETGGIILAQKHDDGSVASQIVDRTRSPVIHLVYDRDLQGNIIRTTNIDDLKYDARIRPWYIQAKNAKNLIWTDIFTAHLSVKPYLQMAAAIPIYKHDGTFRGVYAMNVRLNYLRKFIESLPVTPHGYVFVINTEDKVLAFPGVPQFLNKEIMNIHALSVPWVIQSYDTYKKINKSEFIFKYQGKNYLALYKPLNLPIKHAWIIGIVAPESDFIGDLVKANLITIGISLIILVLGILILSKLVSRIVSPMKKLVIETDKIKNFELQETKHVHSNIKEVNTLADAIYAMKTGLQSFQKYVPASLVRKLIESGQDVMRGGDKKKLAIFFSDIENFTVISEKADPDDLMKYLCEYFNEISHIITATRGTIDKYIGDSVMALWGAPLPEQQPCQQAARAALQCTQRLSELNKQWHKQGRPVLNTRIGLHFGEVIVGNVGSDERLNYTAIGDAINTSSRLEGINKVYGTHILVSDAVYQQIKDEFILRFVDSVAVKGKKQSTDIYELLAEVKQQLFFDLKAYQTEFTLGFTAYQKQKWDDAIEYFRKCQAIYAEDRLAPVFIERCEQFKSHHPPHDWDGVWRMSEK